ncbi:MAG: tetraacyldisaccharide 4'-kinase [Bacteroidales bacterium]|nr:tetraacyldisaccharide 4'-kinase [Bacteroidales bacterium]MBN2750964.1 tetraacyldisaccharide 4'-kinase [Bacteroidales bacterium]
MAKILLFPFALLYGMVVKIRNKFFDWNIIKSTSFNRSVICIGNLAVGGTGKTPHIEYLVRLLSQSKKVATLSRGYKRKTKGFRFAEVTSTATEVGDEPLQIKRKFPDVTVSVDTDRVNGINMIIKEIPDVDIVLLDDAFQHRRVKPGLSILLTDYAKPYTQDYFMPYGRLRDGRIEMRRADIIIVTKCPLNIKPIDMRVITKDIAPLPYQTVYFTSLKYGKPSPVFGSTNISLAKDVDAIAFAGIASPMPFFTFLEENCNVVEKIAFPDHLFFNEKKIRSIFEKFSRLESKNKIIVTTEKDASRLLEIDLAKELLGDFLFYVPIEVNFFGDQKDVFNNQLIKYAGKNKGNYGIY